MDVAPKSARDQSRGAREHFAEMWCVVRPINYEFRTAMSICMAAGVTARAHIYSLPLVNRPRGVLLVCNAYHCDMHITVLYIQEKYTFYHRNKQKNTNNHQ